MQTPCGKLKLYRAHSYAVTYTLTAERTVLQERVELKDAEWKRSKRREDELREELHKTKEELHSTLHELSLSATATKAALSSASRKTSMQTISQGSPKRKGERT